MIDKKTIIKFIKVAEKKMNEKIDINHLLSLLNNVKTKDQDKQKRIVLLKNKLLRLKQEAT